MRRFSLLVAMCALALVAAGGLVTSNDAALSVPDWPLSMGRIVPPLEGGIRYEFAHRALAVLTAALIAVQAFRMRRPLAWWALAAVLAQAVLGGAVVRLVDPKSLAIAHACLGQLCFGLTAAIAAGYYSIEGAGKSLAPRVAVAVLFLQTMLGAAVRHHAIGPAFHIAGAMAAAAAVMWAALGILMRYPEGAAIRRPAVILLALTGVQVFSGLAAYAALEATADAPQPMPAMVWATVAHVVLGALALGAAIALAMRRPA